MPSSDSKTGRSTNAKTQASRGLVALMLLALPACASAGGGATQAGANADANAAVLPFNPFERAKKGDYAVYRVHQRGGKPPISISPLKSRVVTEEFDDGVATASSAQYSPGGKDVGEGSPRYRRTGAPHLTDYLGYQLGPGAAVSWTDETQTVTSPDGATRSFLCKRARVTNPYLATDVDLWFSSEVPFGLVRSVSTESPRHENPETIELVGWGQSGAEPWGAKLPR